MNSVSRASDFPDEDMMKPFSFLCKMFVPYSKNGPRKCNHWCLNSLVLQIDTHKIGEDKEAYYNRMHIIFLKENSSKKSFEVFSCLCSS
jgi:hypothetical protein